MRILFIFILYFFINCNLYSSAFIENNFSARIKGMGGVFTGIADSIDGITINPSSIASLKKLVIKVEGIYPQTVNWENSILKIGLKGGAPIKMKFYGLVVGGWMNYLSIFNLYKEISFGGTCGIKWKNIKAGLNLKYLSLKYDFPDYVSQFFQTDSKGNINIDAGFDITLFQYFRSGITFINLIPINIGIKEEDKLPLTVKYGISYMKDNYFIISGEIFSSFTDWANFYKIEGWGIGMEKRISSLFLGRMGVNDREVSIGVGFNTFIKNYKIKIDYAINYYYLSLIEYSLDLGIEI